jgi:hypothetical protein
MKIKKICQEKIFEKFLRGKKKLKLGSSSIIVMKADKGGNNDRQTI